MADVLKLALSDYTATGSKIDLLSGGVFTLRRGGWQPKVAAPKQTYRGGRYGAQATFEQFSPVVETMDLLGTGTVSQLIAAETALQTMLDRARTWPLDPSQYDSLWLEWSTDSEPGAGTYAAKRAFIYDATLQMAQPSTMRGGFLDTALYAKLALTRHPFWENMTYKSGGGYSSVSGLGGIESLTSFADGTAPGRLIYMTAAPTASYYDDYWIGIREEGQGTSEFHPTWDLEDGTAGTDTSSTSDATAYGGYKMACTFATTTTLASRVTMTVDQQLGATSHTNENHYVGRYLVLARLKCGSGTVCGVRLDSGYLSAQFQLGNEVYVENTSWELVELGEISIPPQGEKRIYGEIDVGYSQLRIMAERVSGSNGLDLDCLVLIPSTHLCAARGVGTGAESISVWVREDETPIFYAFDTAGGAGASSLALIDWCWPTDPGFFVFAGQRSTGHVLTDVATINLYYVPRWFSYRAAS